MLKSYRDIPKFRRARYAVDIGWDYLEHTLTRWAEDMIVDTDPDFQRCHVWKEHQQRAYVEYILADGEYSKDIKWNHADWMNFTKPNQKSIPIELVDGKQRLEAARKFLRGELKVFGGATSKTLLKESDRDNGNYMPLCASFRFQVNNLPTRKEVLEWYLALNAGGVVHTADEIEKVRKLLDVERQKSYERSE